jgi:hypothetical protein
LAREVVVGLAPARSPEILAEIRHVTSAPLLVDAINGYVRAAAKAAQALGLEHHRDLLVKTDGQLPLKYDVENIIALSRLDSAILTEWAAATAILHVAIERSGHAAGLRMVVSQLSRLAPMASWLVPALVRWAHVRVYELLLGPFEQRVGRIFEITNRVPPEWEDAAVARTPGRPRSLFDKAIPVDDDFTLAYKVKAWWGVRIERETIGEIARRWHKHLKDRQHHKKTEALIVRDCGCLSLVKQGIKEVDRLLSAPD